MKKVKILFFIYQMGAGGAARTLLNIINNLDRDKFSVVLVTLNFDGSYEKDVRSDVKFIKLSTSRLSRSVYKLADIIRKEKIDIVFSTIPRVNTIAIIANRMARTHAINVIREADNLGGTVQENVKLRLFGMVYKLSAQIVSLSEGVKDNLVKRYGIKEKEIKVIYNPVDLNNISEKMKKGKIDPDFEAIFATDEKVIITAGRLVKQKDHHTLIKAFSRVNEQVKSRLVILGEGPLKDELVEQARSLGIENRVYFIGFQQNPYIYFTHSDLFVLSSIHEGFSHVVAEALATGTPVVSTDCKSGPREVLDNGKYGLLSDVGNADELASNMVKVLTYEPAKLNEVVNQGYKRAEAFDAKKIVKQYEQIFLAKVEN